MSRIGPITKDSSTVALGLAQIRVGASVSNIATTTPVLAAANSIGALASTKYTGNVDYWKLESGFPLLEDLSIPLRETAMLECEFKEISSFNLALARGIDPNAATSATATKGTVVSTAGTITGDITVADNTGPTTENWTVFFTGATAGEIIGSASGLVHSFTAVDSAMEPIHTAVTPNLYFSLPANFFSGTWAEDDSYTFSTTAYVAGTASYADVHAGSINLGSMVSPAYIRMEAVYTFPNGTNTMTIIFPRANVVSSVELDMQAEDSALVPITIESKGASSDSTGGNAAWDSAPLGTIIFA